MKTEKIRTWVEAWAVPLAAIVAMFGIGLVGVNETIFLAVNGLSRYTGDALWANWTVLGDAMVALALCLPFAGRRPDMLWALLLAAVLTTLGVHSLKPWLATPRPPAMLAPELIHIIGPVLRKGSFPSGHTSTAFAYVTVLILMHRARWIWAVFILAVGVGISRMAVGVHWPMDVLGGVALGWASAALAVRWAQRWTWGTRYPGYRIAVVLPLLAALWLLVGYDTGYKEAGVLQRVIAGLVLLIYLAGLIQQRKVAKAQGS